MLLIQGCFFQESSGIDLGLDPEDGTPSSILVMGLMEFLFSGVIASNPNCVRGTLSGYLNDYFGTAEIFGITVEDDVISFTKRYQNRQDTILYQFVKKLGNTWVGTYGGEQCGRGVARCVITEVDDNFFSAQTIVATLGLKKAFTPPHEGIDENGLF